MPARCSSSGERSRRSRGANGRARITVQMCGSPISEKRAARTRARGQARRVVTSIPIMNHNQLSPIKPARCSSSGERGRRSRVPDGSRARTTFQMCGSPISEKRAARTRARGQGRRVVTSITIINHHQLSPIKPARCSSSGERSRRSRGANGPELASPSK